MMKNQASYDVVIKDLVKRYKNLQALDHVDLSIRPGELFGLLGPNGSGKTTLIHCLFSLLRYDYGSIQVFGEKMGPEKVALKEQMGLVPQEVAVYEDLSVEENVDYFCGLYVRDSAKRKQAVQEALEFAQLEEFRKFRPQKLSGGLKRRLNLACGIAHNPKLLVLDEPTVAVDPQSRNRILEGIRELNQQGTTVIYTSHYMEEIEQLCDRIIILDQGKVLVSGSCQEIINDSSIGETITIEAYQVPQSVLQELNHRPEILSAKYEQNVLTLRMNSEEGNLIPLLHFLEERKINPVKITSRQPSLNDVFLEITGKELRDHVS